MAGSPQAAAAAVLAILVWFGIGVFAGFSEQWLSLMVAVTGVLTFIMVFFIQHTTGRESRAVLLKLDELLRATIGARNDLIAAEQRPLHEQEHLEAKPPSSRPSLDRLMTNPQGTQPAAAITATSHQMEG